MSVETFICLSCKKITELNTRRKMQPCPSCGKNRLFAWYAFLTDTVKRQQNIIGSLITKIEIMDQLMKEHGIG